MHGRPYTRGTSYDESLDSAAEAVMSSGSGQARLRLGGQVRWGLLGELPAKLSCSGAPLAVLA